MEQIELFVERSQLFQKLIARRYAENSFLEMCEGRLWRHCLSPIAQRTLALVSSDRVLAVYQHEFEKQARNSI
ncbi:hypothetical protein CPT_Muldoon_080 [Serratia phage Muldoon]|uniref:Uncharacterized protein n=1 Tax=Serratia phage Muldoon TaxID=2601678 RepID=A0A5P8PHA3_9CAUD|nr:hypothetical protein HYP94_gp079 [Serratia phage Muldoon]QFR56035.1 hypothetical protein CPT_Muldoon_080 [Serratia phage Muldoon]